MHRCGRDEWHARGQSLERGQWQAFEIVEQDGDVERSCQPAGVIVFARPDDRVFDAESSRETLERRALCSATDDADLEGRSFLPQPGGRAEEQVVALSGASRPMMPTTSSSGGARAPISPLPDRLRR